MTRIDRVYEAAIRSLKTCCVEGVGLQASGRREGHHQVWARDAMIALLGGALVDDSQICSALGDSLHVLRSRQAANGAIPNNVDSVSGKANFRAYADSGLWWTIGSAILDPDPETISRVLAWCGCQDVDQTGLISIQESSDWQDLFCTRGKALTVNCLHVLALKLCGRRLSKPDLLEKAESTAEAINHVLWYNGDGNLTRTITHTFSTDYINTDSLGRKRWIPLKQHLHDDCFYLPYVAFRIPGEWFDTLGNLLAILSGVASPEQTGSILAMIERHRLGIQPVLSLHPAIQPGDSDWRDYYASLNLPHEYHNGGIWPFIGGFYVATLVHAGRLDQAERALDRLAELNERGEFNEWHHGLTGEPKGVRDQAWSAGSYIWARECVRQGRVIWFQD